MADVWSPRWAVRPGEVLVEALEERGMTQAELGRRMGRPLKTISEIATGKTAITADTALQLERVLGIPASIWLGLETNYQEARARERERVGLEEHVTWLKQFPVRELIARRIIPRGNPVDQAAALLEFFEVSSPLGWEQHWGRLAGSFRMSSRRPASSHAVALWLRLAELEAAKVALPRFDVPRARSVVPSLRPLTAELVIASAISHAADVLHSVGIGLLLIEAIPRAPVSGALRWMGHNPWVVLSLRYRTDDQLWFSLFHELGHLLATRRRHDVVLDLEGAESTTSDEQLADEWAREQLVPQTEIESWLRETTIDRAAITKFAAAHRVSPGIIVGRLQRDGVLQWTQFNDLKQPLPDLRHFRHTSDE